MAEVSERHQVNQQLQTPQVVDAAEDVARYLLQSNQERLRHSAAVAAQAKILTAAVTAQEAPLLVAAAWLHDIGYADALQDTGFHSLDGARYLKSTGWPRDVFDLVAHHSGSPFVATIRQLNGELSAFYFIEDPLTDALTVADQTAGPNGRVMTVDERMRDMLSRHGADSPNARAHSLREPYLRATTRRVTARLIESGIDPSAHYIG